MFPANVNRVLQDFQSDQDDFAISEKMVKDSLGNAGVLQEGHSNQDMESQKGDTYEHVSRQLMEEQINSGLKQSHLSDIKQPSNPEDILKFIISRGEYSEVKELFGCKWEFKALNQEELLEAFDKSAAYKDTQYGQMSALMFEQLVHSIVSINGISIYEFFPDKVRRADFPDTTSYVRAVRRTLSVYLKKFPPSVVDKLYEAYIEVESKRNAALQELKNL